MCPCCRVKKQFSELQMATAVEGKSTEHVLKTLQDADAQRAELRAQKADLQSELDALRAANMEQHSKLMDLQATKMALADAEAKVTQRK